MPASKMRLSPGRKNPTSNPVSAKITNNSNHRPPYSMMLLGSVSLVRNSHISLLAAAGDGVNEFARVLAGRGGVNDIGVTDLFYPSFLHNHHPVAKVFHNSQVVTDENVSEVVFFFQIV